MRRSAPALLLPAMLAILAVRVAGAQGECPAVLHPSAGGVRWCDLAEKPRLAPDAPLPRYANILRSLRLSGEVDLTAEIDDSGRVVPASVHLLHSTHDLFLVNVRSAMKSWRFVRATGSAGGPIAFLVRATFDLSADDVPTEPIAEVATTPAGLDLQLGRAAIPFAPPAHVDSIDVDGAVAAAIDSLYADQKPDSLRPLCLARGRSSALPGRMVAMLHVPPGRTFTPDRCPPTYARAYVVLDSHGRPLPTETAPPGHRDPLWLTVTDVRPWTADVFRVQAQAQQGTWGHVYHCDARRVGTAHAWRAECFHWTSWIE